MSLVKQWKLTIKQPMLKEGRERSEVESSRKFGPGPVFLFVGSIKSMLGYLLKYVVQKTSHPSSLEFYPSWKVGKRWIS